MAGQEHTSWSFTTIGMALLASSCCVIQLVLNMLSISCAGFAVLTPYRPWFTLATLATFTLAWQRQKYNKDRRVLFWTACVAAVLLASPELVRYMNESTSTPGISPPIVLQLDGLGCLACANKIKQGLMQVPGVAEALVFFDNSTALVKCNTPCAVPELVKTVEGLGSYRAWVVSK